MDLESDFVFDEITNVAYPLLAEVCLNESFAKKELIEEKSVEMAEIKKKIIDLLRNNGAVFNEVIRMQNEFLNKLENIIKGKK